MESGAMEDSQSTGIVGDERVLAVAERIVRTLGTSKNPTDDVVRLLSEFDIRFSSPRIVEALQIGGVTNELEARLNSAQEKVMSLESDQSMIWYCGQEDANEYLQAVDQVRQLIEDLGKLPSNEDQELNGLLCRAHSVLQMAMARLEEEFSHMLVQNKQNFEPEHMSFRSSEDDILDEESTTCSIDDFSADDAQMKVHGDSSKGLEEFVIDLVHPDVVHDLKCIANTMFKSNYDRECCQAYKSIRKVALDECLFILEFERLSIEEVVRMEWSSVNTMIKKWIRAMKIFVRVYLPSEKRLCDMIFGELGSVSHTCFVETSKSAILQLLNFGEAIAISPRSVEKLFRICDMYECLEDLLLDIDALFVEEAGSSVITEGREVLKRLGDSVAATFGEFENNVRTKTSTTPFAGGGVHHLTKYVMNYLKVLAEYSDTLNSLLCDLGSSPSLLKINGNVPEDGECASSCNASAVVQGIQSVISTLEANLDGKSKLYRDSSLQHFFLMNNIYYMVQKVKGSDLGALLGDDWIRRHNGKFQLHAKNYERASWTTILSFLKDEGVCNPGSNSVSKTVLKERFRNFNIAFEETYKTQTAWLIPDPQLREDLRISISLKVLQAYRTFMGRYSTHLEGGKYGDKYIKYSPDDLQYFLLDLFEGSPKSLHNPRWK